MRVIKRMAACVAVSVLVCGSATAANASSISFSFDCDINGPACSPVASVGTLTITDSLVNSNWVDISLTLVGPSDPQSFYFNFTGFPLAAGYTFKATTDPVTVSQDLLQADGYTIGLFDLSVPKNGNISGNPYNTVLRLSDAADSSYADLDASMFAALSTDGALYAAVQITAGGGWFGATSCIGCQVQPPPPAPVPEPASVLLLGGGLVAGAAKLRRRKRASRP